MGTEALVRIYDARTQLVEIHKQTDGHPHAFGKDLIDEILSYRLVQGISIEDRDDSKVANRAGCLAAAVVGGLKRRTGPGNLYLVSPGRGDEIGYEYVYDVFVGLVGEVTLHVRGGGVSFYGSPADFLWQIFEY